MIQFANTTAFYGLWAVLGLCVFLWVAAVYKKKRLQKFADAKLMETLAANRYAQRETGKSVLLVCVFFLSVLALARPQWGFFWQDIKRQGLDIVIAVDVSRSMFADDVRPNRLERAKLAVKDMMRKLQGDRLGLVAFAGDAFLVCPLTVDYAGFLLSLEDLGPHTVSRGGTNIGAAILESIKAHQGAEGDSQVIMIITDGETHEGDPFAAAKKASSKGIPIFSIGIGTPEGSLIRIKNEHGEYEFLKDRNGNFVKSRLDEQTLKEISLLTDGAYVRSVGAEFGLDYIYQTRLSKMEKQDIEGQMRKQPIDRYFFPLAFAFIFLVTETLITTRKKI